MSGLILDPSLDPAQDERRGELIHERSSPAAFRWEVDDHNIGWLTFDTPRSSANVLNEATLHELEEHITDIEDNPTLRGLVIRSAKEKVFVAGADLKAVRSLPPERLEGLILLGQAVFNRLAALRLPKVALIHGACVGGGLELALACDVRVASDDESTKLGLPEVQLGLIPGWGGSTRLPRLIGLPAALDMILTGKLVKASHARKLGIVDHVAPVIAFTEAARYMLAKPLPKRKALPSVLRWPLATALRWKARRDVMAKTHGLYEAPLLALDVATRGYHSSADNSLAMEREAILHLAHTPETGRLIDLFFAKETASKKPLGKGHALPVTNAAVIGAGVMGAGIAHWLASHGVTVTLSDINADAVARGVQRIHELNAQALKHRALTPKQARETMDRLHPTHERVPLHRCQLIIEAATEDMALKKKIFAELATRCGPDTVLATNTSALSVRELAETVPHPERVLGLHFFNPVHRMPLMEVITHPGVSDDALATAHGFVQAIGKVPVVVKDSPGFVVNRILVPYLMDGVKLFLEGQPIEHVDRSMVMFGMPMGPLRLLDEIGLDVAIHVARTLGADTTVLERMTNAGMLGKKNGQGFYLHGQSTLPNPAALKLQSTSAAPLPCAEIQHRLAGQLSLEAVRVLEEGVAASARDVDLAMVLGTGYAPFRGGPLAHLGRI